MAEILAFPLARRGAFVRRQAAWYASQSAKAAEANLFHQLQVQRDVLLDKGVDPAAVEREVRSLEGVIRAAIWSLVLSGGVA